MLCPQLYTLNVCCMGVGERLESKYLYKLLLIMLKYIPILITVVYMINAVLNLLGVSISLLEKIAGMSLLTWTFMYLASSVFKFCIYHKLFLYYILTTDLINIINCHFVIPNYICKILLALMILLGIILFMSLYAYVENNKKFTCKSNRGYRCWEL